MKGLTFWIKCGILLCPYGTERELGSLKKLYFLVCDDDDATPTRFPRLMLRGVSPDRVLIATSIEEWCEKLALVGDESELVVVMDQVPLGLEATRIFSECFRDRVRDGRIQVLGFMIYSGTADEKFRGKLQDMLEGLLPREEVALYCKPSDDPRLRERLKVFI